jgi:hypothetical protein
VIREVFKTWLDDNPEYDQELGNSIARDIRSKLKGADATSARELLVPRPLRAEMGLPRYKFMVQVIVGENKGEGVQIGSRCLWDSATDNMATDSATSVRQATARIRPRVSRCVRVGPQDKIFVTAMVFGVYLY